MNPVEIVNISKKIKIFKENQEANSIEVVNFNFQDGSECGFNVISQKDLYEIGDLAVYIQPDYCLSNDIELFDSFTKPNGDIKKSKLGRNNRIRAVKFNFSFEGKSEPIYSYGILLPIYEVENYFGDNYDKEKLMDLLKITKYEEPETGYSGLTKGGLPPFLYMTDESIYANIKSHIEKLCDGNTEMGWMVKRDGSSGTVYVKKRNGEWTVGVCSRTMEKKLEQEYIISYIEIATDIEYTKYYNKETGEKGFINNSNKKFFTQQQIDELVYYGKLKQQSKEIKDTWVELSKSTGLLDNLLNYCKTNNIELAVRFEVFGAGMKGSGNKLNPDSNKKQGIYLFGIDDLSSGFAKRINFSSSEHNLEKIGTLFNLEYAKSVWYKPTSYDDFVNFSKSIIEENKQKGIYIEGVVVRTKYTNDLSCKLLSDYYDSQK